MKPPMSKLRHWTLLATALWPLWAQAQTPQDAEVRRLLEIQVELAWLADPLTFPYFLDAQLQGQTLEIHGHVPSPEVRERACQLARLYCPLAIQDVMREHASLAVRPVRRPPQQLQHMAASSLRLALPASDKILVSCALDGQVTLQGTVTSWEEKLAASQALRRLHGCLCVANQLDIPTVPGHDAHLHHFPCSPVIKASAGLDSRPQVHTNPPQSAAAVNRRPVIVPASLAASGDVKKPEPKKLLGLSQFGPAMKEVRPSLPGGVKTSAESDNATLTEAGLQERLVKALGKDRPVTVRFLAPTAVRVELPARNQSEANQLAERVFALLDLPPTYHVEVNLLLAP